MKKRAVIIALIAAVMCMPAAGCQNTDSAANTAEQQVILVQGEALWAESANTFDELYAASDLVMEITVADTEAVYVIDSVETLITPEVVKVWKGDWQGEQLFVFGGDISAQDFKNTASENDRVHLSGYSEEQLAESVVQW